MGINNGEDIHQIFDPTAKIIVFLTVTRVAHNQVHTVHRGRGSKWPQALGEGGTGGTAAWLHANAF